MVTPPGTCRRRRLSFPRSCTASIPHAAVDGLHHVVDGEAGDRDGGQRLHLDAGLAGDLHRCGHVDAGEGLVRHHVHGDLG